MKIPLVDLKAQYAAIKPDIDAAIQRVLDSTAFILGAEVETFESAFARYVGAAGAVGVASGTSAVSLALRAVRVGPGDEVIAPAHTFVATAEAISHCGATPVFVDIDPITYQIDPNRVEDAITPRTRAILPVHLYGHPAPMTALLEIARRRGVHCIEDAAQAHGAECDGRRCGTIGDLACFSFYPGKNLGGYGDGGAVTGNDDTLLARVRKLRDHGRTTKYEHDEIGYGERLDALQAAVLGVKLRHLDEWNDARRRHAGQYASLLAGEDVTLPVEVPGARHIYHLFVIRSGRRDELLAQLKARGIGAGIHYPIPVHRQPAYVKQGYGSTSLPITERAAADILSLPMYPELTTDQIAYVVESVKEAGVRC